ncbi:MAG: ATP-binding cassette domain-containing protein [Candidatus Omnitrophota bacterium]
MKTMVEVKDLKKYFYKNNGFFGAGKDPVKAVDGISFSVEEGKTFGLVGESGCGKSTIAKLLAGIYKADAGEIIIKGEKDIVFQDPFSSLNPRMKVRQILGESLLIRKTGANEINLSVRESLKEVRLDTKNCMDKYPHQFSGGERQRIAIARALMVRPKVLILDEPVSSLDVSIQAGILNLLKDIQEELDLTYIFISHDLRIVEFMADFAGVMKDGCLVEVSSKKEIYSCPKSAYTRHLLDAIPGM